MKTDLEANKIYRHEIMEIMRSYTSSEKLDRLCKRYYKDNDKSAREELIIANLPSVIHHARKYAKDKFDLLDLVQEGNIGLMQAIDMFDYDKGFKFSTYAQWYILKCIRKYTREHNTLIRLPDHQVTNLINIKKEYRRLESETNDDITFDVISKNLGMDLEMVEYLFKISQDLDSTNRIITDRRGEGNSTEIGDLIIDETTMTDNIVVEKIMNSKLNEILLDVLNEREIIVIYNRFGFVDGRTYTYAKIGEKLGITKQRAQQIEKTAIAKLKKDKYSALKKLL